MKKWTSIDQALTPAGQTISLREHDGTYTILVEGVQLMSTRRHASEEKIAELACAHIKGIREAHVLIGGLGFGFTLRACLAALAPDASVVVAELLDAVITWNRNPSLPLAADALSDRRVTIQHRDVVDLIRAARGAFDAIILDVDNGPAGLSAASNDWLYDDEGLRGAYAALKPRGCIAFWSAGPDAAFGKRMARAGFAVDVQRCRAHTNSGGWHTLFIGRLPRS